MYKMILLLLLLVRALSGVWADPIHDAASKGDVAAVTKLLAGNPTLLEARNASRSATPLLMAARAGQEAMVTLLLAHGADISAQDRRQDTVLIYAVSSGSLPVVQLLLDKGADPKVDSVLSAAAINGSLPIVQLLLDKGADPKVGSVLWFAAMSGSLPVVQLLLDKGAYPNSKGGPDDFTPLQAARQFHKNSPIIALLLARGAKDE